MVVVTKAESDRRWLEKYGKDRYYAELRAKRASYRAANPIIPKPLLDKIKKSCIRCNAAFEVFPCLDRIKCCSRRCSAQIKGEKFRGPRLPAVRACKCGRVEELKRSQCGDCRKISLSNGYHRNKVKWTEEQRESRRLLSKKYANRNKIRRREDPEYRRSMNLRAAENDGRRRAQILKTRTQRISYKKLLEEFGMNCNICAGPIADGELSFDHVIPLVRGGTHTMDNLRPAHTRCNISKNRRLPEEYVCRFKVCPQK